MIRLFNSLGRQLQDFEPIKAGLVSLYTCGPTVYDYVQLGNLRAFVFDDTLRRMLEASDLKVSHVMNITNVGHLVGDDDEGEDKLEKGAKREGQTVWQVADKYTKAFLDNAADLNLLQPNGYEGKPNHYALATDFIKEQIEVVQRLVDKGFAYKTDQAIYFDVTKLKDYGKLSGQKLDEKAVGAREDVVTDDNKKHPQDFALWFFTVGRFKDHEMHWDSPWGKGFPGWHLECSAIIHATLSEPVDIHTGGVDHIGTHHTNEIAQTEAAYGRPLAHYWLHNEFLLVDGQKMAKSAGNFHTLKDVKDKGYDPLALRLLFLQSHYRSQTNFTWEALAAAQTNLLKLRALADLRFQTTAQAKHRGDWPKVWYEVLSAVQNDLGTPAALAILNAAGEKTIAVAKADIDEFNIFLTQLDGLLGLRLAESNDISSGERRLIDEREAARKANDYAKADQLRDELKDHKIEINDTEAGPIWSRLN